MELNATVFLAQYLWSRHHLLAYLYGPKQIDPCRHLPHKMHPISGSHSNFVILTKLDIFQVLIVDVWMW